jgi:uncharacterized protein (TIGR03067 family)
VQRPDLWPDLQRSLDEVLSHLPDKYRVAIVLCDLEGKTRKEAARQLGVPEGTLAARLARARTMLAKRLARHGPAMSVGTLAAVLSEKAASACVPSSVMSSTIEAITAVAAGQAAAAGLISAKVAALTEGILKTMLFAKLRVALAVLLVLVIACYAVRSLPDTATAQQAQVENPPATDSKALADAARQDAGAPEKPHLQGTWSVVSLLVEGTEEKFDHNLGEVLPIDVAVKKMKWVFAADTLMIRTGTKTAGGKDLVASGTYTFDTATTPHKINITFVINAGDWEEQVTALGIYALDKDELRLCLGRPGYGRLTRPLKFESKGGDERRRSYYVLRREGWKNAPNKEKSPSGRVENVPGTETQREAAALREGNRGEFMQYAVDGLADWPSDAPLELRPRVEKAALDQKAAEQKVRQYLGIDKAKEILLAPAYLTDNDFPFLRPHKQAIWLAEVKDLKVPAIQGKPAVLPRLYVAIDAKTGQLIEAFTPPAQPWWREKKQVIGPAHEKYLRETGQTLERTVVLPKLTLIDALQGMVEGDQGQIVVRYAVYTNGSVERRPSLLLFREGLHLRKGGPPPGGGEAIGRSMIVLDAQTGAELHNESSGN